MVTRSRSSSSSKSSASVKGGKLRSNSKQDTNGALPELTNVKTAPAWSNHVRVKVRSLDEDGRRYEWKQIEVEEFDYVFNDNFGIDSSSPKTIDLLIDQEDFDVEIVFHKTRVNTDIYQYLSKIPGILDYREVSTGLNTIKISKPFGPLYHDRIRNGNSVLGIEDPSKLTADKDREELSALIDLLKLDLVKKHHEEISGNRVRFRDLWKLYLPESLIVVDELKYHSSIRRIESVSYTEEISDPDAEFKIVCTEISHDGLAFRERRLEVTQEYYAGTKEIADLNARPIHHYGDSQTKKLVRRLCGRGQRFRDYCQLNEVKVMDHEGFAFLNGEESKDDHGEKRISGRVVIDPHVFERAPGILGLYDFVRQEENFAWAPTEQGEMSEKLELQYARCSAKLPVFSLLEDEWFVVAVDDLKKPWSDHEQTDEAWKKIIGDQKHKKKLDLLYGLVKQWSKKEEDELTAKSGSAGKGLNKSRGLPDPTVGKPATSSPIDRRFSSLGNPGRPTDIVGPDKGQGLIIMLHGPSGVGKTMTAECLADAIKKPLYRIDLAKISGGTRYVKGRAFSTTMESEIERIFQNAQTWKAILLLDEAEAIMIERSPDKMEQNSWVSAFLRKVEYYKGILILTTNMIHLIDPAFESRVTFAVKYEESNTDTRRQIWNMFIDRMDLPGISDQDKNKLKAKVRSQWSKQPLNGRQIRNICHAAEILAKAGPADGLGESIEHYIQELFDDTKEFVGQIVQAREAAEEQSLRDMF